MSKKINVKEERAIMVAYGCSETEIKEYFLVFRDMRTPNFSLKQWKNINADYINETLRLLETEYVKIPRDLMRFLGTIGKKGKLKLKRRKSKADLRRQVYFFIRSRPSTSLNLIKKFLTDNLNIPHSDANTLLSELKNMNISGYKYLGDCFQRDSEKMGIDGVRIDVMPNVKTIDVTNNNIIVGEALLKDEKFCLALLPLLAKSVDDNSDLVEYAQNIYTTYIGLKYGDN